MDEELITEETIDKSEAKNAYKKIGLFLFSFAAISVGVQFGVEKLLVLFSPNAGEKIINEAWFIYLLSVVPMYLIALPISLKIIDKEPINNKPTKKLTFKQFLELYLICVPLMYAGNLIGTLLSTLINGGAYDNPLNEIMTQNQLLNFLFAVIIAPIMEEFVFRKTLIDHTSKYGEGIAIVFSALCFGLFHMNLYQFFYAFAIGMIFGFVYTKTKQIKYSIFMHMIINFFGGIVATAILTEIDIDMLSSLTPETIMYLDPDTIMSLVLPCLGLLAYAFGIIVIAIIGLVILIKKRDKFVVDEVPFGLEKKEVINNAYINVGFILFLVICIGFTIASFI